MSYANDRRYIYIDHTKLIKKQKQTFEIEKHRRKGHIFPRNEYFKKVKHAFGHDHM